jgi:hypothetical protein
MKIVGYDSRHLAFTLLMYRHRPSQLKLTGQRSPHGTYELFTIFTRSQTIL